MNQSLSDRPAPSIECPQCSFDIKITLVALLCGNDVVCPKCGLTMKLNCLDLNHNMKKP